MAQEVCVVVGAEDQCAVDRDHRRSEPAAEASAEVPNRSVLGGSAAGHRGSAPRRVSRPAVWRWQRRYAEAGLKGLLRDKTRPPGKASVAPATVAEVRALTCAEPPGETTHWTGRAMAKAVGLSFRTIQRIWEKHRLQPHRIRTFKRSTDPAFAEKVEDIVGLYMHPPAHAVVLNLRNSTAR